MKYMIAQAPTLEALVVLVNEWVEKGYRPIGGVSVSVVNDGDILGCHQAILKDEPQAGG